MSPREQGLLPRVSSGADGFRGYRRDPGDIEQEVRLQYGGIGALLGLLLGIVVGSKVTFHTPIRRRNA